MFAGVLITGVCVAETPRIIDAAPTPALTLLEALSYGEVSNERLRGVLQTTLSGGGHPAQTIGYVLSQAIAAGEISRDAVVAALRAEGCVWTEDRRFGGDRCSMIWWGLRAKGTERSMLMSSGESVGRPVRARVLAGLPKGESRVAVAREYSRELLGIQSRPVEAALTFLALDAVDDVRDREDRAAIRALGVHGESPTSFRDGMREVFADVLYRAEGEMGIVREVRAAPEELLQNAALDTETRCIARGWRELPSGRVNRWSAWQVSLTCGGLR